MPGQGESGSGLVRTCSCQPGAAGHANDLAGVGEPVTPAPQAPCNSVGQPRSADLRAAASSIDTPCPGTPPRGPDLCTPKNRPYVSRSLSCRLLPSRHVPSGQVADRCRRRRCTRESNPGRPVTLCHIPFESVERFSSRCLCADALLELPPDRAGRPGGWFSPSPLEFRVIEDLRTCCGDSALQPGPGIGPERSRRHRLLLYSRMSRRRTSRIRRPFAGDADSGRRRSGIGSFVIRS